jgi:hypothetical protein
MNTATIAAPSNVTPFIGLRAELVRISWAN